jgi:phosphate-selective porin OprO and OprP
MPRTQIRKPLLLLLAMTAFAAGQSRAQQPAQSPSVPVADPNAGPSEASDARGEPGHSLQNTIDATESWEPPPPPRKMVRFNEYRGPYITARYGAGLLLEHGAFAQDTISKEQIVMHPEERLRDFRFILGGRIAPHMERSLTWSAGIMYDGPNHRWLVRQTGVMIAVPELWGNFFVGRSKEGFSLLKIMVGYDGWTMERPTISDATIPILADGIKWLGYSPKYHFLWNAGYFNDVLSHEQTFSTYSSQEVGRFVWLPIHSDDKDKVLDLGVAYRYGKPENNKLRLRSRPEAFTAPYFIDTGSIPADSTWMLGYEAYYRENRWLFGSEYWWIHVSSPSTNNPVFNGGDIVTTYLFNDASRVYNTAGGFFRAVSPKRSVFQGGPGAWELVLRYSYIDLDNQRVQGGKFGRFTPMVNWHMSNNMRLELGYGYGRLDRFDLKGNTQFFQSRIQLQF